MKLLHCLLTLALLLPVQQLTAQETKENADFKLAVNLYNDKLYDLAFEQFQQFVNSYPNTPQGIEARFYLGLTQSKLRRFEEARFTFQNFALAFPDHPKAPEAWWNVADAFASLGNAGEAAQAFERVKTFHPRSTLAPSALLRAGEFHLRAKDTASAIRVLRALTQDYTVPGDVVPARLSLAEIHLRQGQPELARAEARRVADAGAAREFIPRSLLILGTALRDLGQLQEARDALQRCAREYPADPESHRARLLLGSVHRELGDVTEAERVWIALASDSLRAEAEVRQEALLNLAGLYENLGENRKALDVALRGAAVKGPRTGEAYFRAGRLSERAGSAEQAGRLYLGALTDTASARTSPLLVAGAFRGSLLLQDVHQATRILEDFRARFPEDPLLPRMLLEAARFTRTSLGDPRHAVELAEEIMARFPASPLADDALMEKGLGLRAAGALEEAMEVFEQLAARYPAGELAPAARDQARRIRLFELKERSAGIENLALLVGEVIENRSKADLTLRLAEIFFNDLKDYARAAGEYGRALKLGLDRNARRSALLRQAQCYDYLAWRDRMDGSDTFRRHAEMAVTAYDSLFSLREPSPELDEARLSRMRLRLLLARSVQDVSRAADDAASGFRFTAQAWIDAGDAYRRLRETNRALAACERASDAADTDELRAGALFRRAQLLTESGRADSAVGFLETYNRRYPTQADAPRVLNLLARHYAAHGRGSDAVRLFDEIEQRFFYTGVAEETDLNRAESFFAGNDPALAVRYYERWHRRTASDVFSREVLPATSLLHMAMSYDRLGLLPQAKAGYQQLLTRDTSAIVRGTALYALAEIARKEKNIGLATRYLEEAGRTGSAAGAGRNPALEAAELLFLSEQYAAALERYRDVARTAASDSLKRHIESRSIVALFRLENLKEADQRATAFVKRYPQASADAAEFEYERGRYHLRREELEPALRRLQNAATRYRGASVQPEAAYWIGRVYEMQNKPQDAVRLYDSLLQRHPDHPIAPRVQLSLGNTYFTLEQWDPAGRLYKALVDNEQRAPDLLPYAMSNLIMVYKELQLFDAALQLTRTYIERFPDDPDLISKRVDIGVLYQKLGYNDQSILHLQSLLANADADLEAELRYYIGEAYFAKGDYQQAVLEFLKVPYLVTRSTKADWVSPSYYMAGQSYEKLSKFEQAINMYQQIIDRPGIDPTFKAAAQKEIDRVTALTKSR